MDRLRAAPARVSLCPSTAKTGPAPVSQFCNSTRVRPLPVRSLLHAVRVAADDAGDLARGVGLRHGPARLILVAVMKPFRAVPQQREAHRARPPGAPRRRPSPLPACGVRLCGVAAGVGLHTGSVARVVGVVVRRPVGGAVALGVAAPGLPLAAAFLVGPLQFGVVSSAEDAELRILVRQPQEDVPVVLAPRAQAVRHPATLDGAVVADAALVVAVADRAASSGA